MRRAHSRIEARHGFTLIELLVVIAIIAILAAILFPVFARARENARKATCQSNLKQLALAAAQYRQDYDERMFRDRMPTTNPPGPANTPPYQSSYCGVVYFWKDILQPYVKNTGIFVCPSDKQNTLCVVQVVRSYSPNTELMDYGIGGGPVKDPQVEDAAGTLMLMDANYNSRVHYTDPGSYNMPGNPASRHMDGWNIAFYDGHVKWLKKIDNGIFTLQAGD